ncbi:MAG TPA: hypothetical protein VFB80_18680 [Pirellulaceae bacterium]|nr:hypothetical protein [Pirellulaceae bacterium]
MRHIDQSLKAISRAHNNSARSSRKFVTLGKRARISSTALRGPYLPPENWHEPRETPQGKFCVVMQPAGAGFRHVLTKDDVRERLARLPEWMVEPLQVVQFSQMTQKKRRSPCYGMQWGQTIYLYPIEESRIEVFHAPPKPAQRIEAAMYGARWQAADAGRWHLVWTEDAIRDFYLNNVLIHELGHILDSRNTSHRDRERYAEWFALEMGYKASRRADLAERAAAKYVVRRHG